MALLTLLDGQLAHGDLPLLDRAAFSMESGERIGLIGRNGTGKSSLLSVIAGLQSLDDGELRKSQSLRVALVRRSRRCPRILPLNHKVEEFLHRFGLAEDFSPANASGGERKRAALALAFAQQPDLLLLDEPTNHLDMSGILSCWKVCCSGSRRRSWSPTTARSSTACATRIVELDRGTLRSPTRGISLL